ncbi:NusG domain II-containing protein [Acetobacterium bakii]|uniref:Uncharacterized protein n=1 Tax=Acetobacterium bakii TaxID=52689 RepID=A0A0L6TXS6_9FIRM|nr:NusG domain II-containing protein [Acetobacterium bakii]KNZ41058.1 hypothetical protein AKG39_14120 [Acetobacterium bakii]
MKKKEIITIIILLAIALAGIGLFYGLNATEEPLSVRVSHQGEVVAVLPLSVDCTETFSDASGYNTLEISNGQAKILESDCSEQICVHTHSISNPGETIVCLPHKLIVEIITGEN